jgi:hypothetical protein
MGHPGLEAGWPGGWPATGRRTCRWRRAVEWALGVGDPVRYARLQPGRAIGLDVLEELCERGRGHAAQAGVEGWTEFRRREMEDIPLPDESVGVAISNGVLNLSARTSRALRWRSVSSVHPRGHSGHAPDHPGRAPGPRGHRVIVKAQRPT